MDRRNPVILNDYKSTKGKTISQEVKTELIEIDLDAEELAKGPAEAIKDAVADAIKGISKNASKSTLSSRRRLGITGTKLFNATGKLLRGLKVVKNKGSYETVAPSGRLSGDEAKLVPLLFEEADLDGKDLMGERGVKKAVEETTAEMIKIKKRR